MRAPDLVVMYEIKTSKEKSERKYTSIACLECRKRKVKCNNDTPKCSNCAMYNVECVFGQDRRRASESVRRKATQSTITVGEEPTTISLSPEKDVKDPSQSIEGDMPLQWEAFTPHPFDNQTPQREENGFANPSLGFSFPQQGWDIGSDAEGIVASIANPLHFSPNEPVPYFHDPSFGFREHSDIEQFNVFVETPETSPASFDPSPQAVNVEDSSGPTLDQAGQEYGEQTNRNIPPVSKTRHGTLRGSQEPNIKIGRARPHDLSDVQASSLNDVTKQLTSRLGRLQIAEDGQARYYGATSNLHILHSGFNSLVQPNIRTVVTHGKSAIAQAGLQWQGDELYENHLINLFFSWHNALMYVVDRAVFFRERQRYKQGYNTDLYSPALENAVYTIGTAYTDRSHPAIADSTDEFFAFRTKTYLEIEIDSPTIATAQALLVLSSHEAAHARESRGWIYSGMAVQIMTDLGLHLNLEKELSRLDSRDVGVDDVSILRRNIFWSTNTIDTLWSAHCGRPSLMKHLIHNVQSPLPASTYKWEFYTDEYSTLKFPAEFDFAAAAYVHVYFASLMKILARVSEVLYSGVPDIANDIEAFVVQADGDYQKWFASLPPRLRLNMSGSPTFYVPAVLEMHLSFHECIILLHRPLITPEDVTSDPGLLPGDRVSSLRKCVDSADEICSILVLFRKIYGLRRPHHLMVHITMTASLIHIFQLSVTPLGSSENKTAQRNFLTCIQALGEMGQTYKSASRALDVVTSLRQSWQDDAFAGDRFKRAKLQ